MGLFDRLFRSSSRQTRIPLVKLGRYSDSYKKPSNYEAWDRSLRLFDEGKYLESYREFFHYLRDDEEDNVFFSLEEGKLSFEIFQGSKKMEGFATTENIKCEAKIARSQSLNVGFMRRLIEKNFMLKYARFALDPQNNLTIVFDTFTLDGSPYKLYYALKEVATNADKLDDLLVDEFKILQQIDNAKIQAVPAEHKEIKYAYIKSQIERVKSGMQPDPVRKDQFPGGHAYSLLNLIYKLDYLTQPEGYMMETLERMHRVYFANDGKSTIEKNQILCKEFDKLIARPKEEFFKEMYQVSFTFGITIPVNHDRIVTFIDSELHHMDWYLDNNYPDTALAIPGYIVGYSLFNYAPPKPIRELLQLFYPICEPDYFRALGMDFNLHDPGAGALNKKSIKGMIEAILEENKAAYPKLHAATGSLTYDSLPAFAKSYLLMIRNMDPVKALD
ncbi:MAG: hypothetical protein KIPDCIKN_01297 [Haliscomenobacter sp.]|nr:hypothetical protein [Haliscomenobacter sp.]